MSCSFDYPVRFLPDESATEQFGSAFAAAMRNHEAEILSGGLNVRLNGDLGAGKTTFTRSVLRALGFQGRVKSPTFTLLEPYQIDRLIINHFDFYRFEDPEEFEEAGFRENFGPGRVCFTEWTSKAEPCVPGADIEIRLTSRGEGRELACFARSEIGKKVLDTCPATSRCSEERTN